MQQWMQMESATDGMGPFERDAPISMLSDMSNWAANALSVGPESRGFLLKCNGMQEQRLRGCVTFLSIVVERCYFCLCCCLFFFFFTFFFPYSSSHPSLFFNTFKAF